MKKYIIAFGLVCLFGSNLFGAADNKIELAKKDFQNYFNTEEKTTLKSEWTSNNSFAVYVNDNGTVRNGYAEYVCLTMNETNDSKKILKEYKEVIISVKDILNNRILGSHKCVDFN